MENNKYKDDDNKENILVPTPMAGPVETVIVPMEEVDKMEIKKEKVYISIDNNVEDIVNLDKDGTELYFEVGARFNKLSAEVIRGLSQLNKMRYNQSFVETQYEEETKPTETLNITPRFATANTRIDVTPIMTGIEFCWKRPEETQYAKIQRYNFAIEGKHCRTFATPEGENPRIGKGGDEELVLMYISKEDHDAIIKAVGDTSRRRNGVVEESTKAKLEKLGGKPFTGSRNDQDWNTLTNK